MGSDRWNIVAMCAKGDFVFSSTHSRLIYRGLEVLSCSKAEAWRGHGNATTPSVVAAVTSNMAQKGRIWLLAVLLRSVNWLEGSGGRVL